MVRIGFSRSATLQNPMSRKDISEAEGALAAIQMVLFYGAIKEYRMHTMHSVGNLCDPQIHDETRQRERL
ncbi:hypothetical protein KSD_45850 [Ktedonobacter sp. SOSP1-85]|nr:hypothetical protein KSD_45850 [Ktedonobacter sp. SOSP1-85]